MEALDEEEEVLEVGDGKGKASVSEILWALQNRSAQAGLIEPGDYSDRAKKVIAQAIAKLRAARSIWAIA